MLKNKSTENLLENIDHEFVWRFKEIADLKSVLQSKKKNDSKEKNVFAKALVLISYSHWEGFVKNISKYYLEYIHFLALNRSQISVELLSSFIFQATLCNKRRSEIIKGISEALSNSSHKFDINIEEFVDAESNLNSKILEKILMNIGIKTTTFLTKHQYIDSVILKYRNDFAHGDDEYIDIDQSLDISEKILELMRLYKTEIENAVVLKRYRM